MTSGFDEPTQPYGDQPLPPAAQPPAELGSRSPAGGRPGRETGRETGRSPGIGRERRGAVSAVWISLIAAAVVLILLIIFIAQNSRTVPIHFFGFAGHLALGLTVLLAAVVGVLVAGLAGSVRILQLRRALKRSAPKDRRSS